MIATIPRKPALSIHEWAANDETRPLRFSGNDTYDDPQTGKPTPINIFPQYRGADRQAYSVGTPLIEELPPYTEQRHAGEKREQS
jgi:hypothetical protein